MKKEITVVFHGRRYPREDRHFDFSQDAMDDFLVGLREELNPFGIQLHIRHEGDVSLEIMGYGDLLNTVRIRSPHDHIANLCLGHIIGASPNLDLFEDIRRGVNRVAFAPEMVEPEGSSKVVCHNCGCGC